MPEKESNMENQEQNTAEETAFNAGRMFERNAMITRLDEEIKFLIEAKLDWANQDVIGGIIRSLVTIKNLDAVE